MTIGSTIKYPHRRISPWTERNKEVGNLLNIQVLDHFILFPVNGEYFSLKGKGFL
ncbi:MAG: hypothetical protein J0H85_15960 [Sediminibacterium magnilacihabitans]|nr:hypothetical protein [Sediminibacterium magnilacihabitans]